MPQDRGGRRWAKPGNQPLAEPSQNRTEGARHLCDSASARRSACAPVTGPTPTAQFQRAGRTALHCSARHPTGMPGCGRGNAALRGRWSSRRQDGPGRLPRSGQAGRAATAARTAMVTTLLDHGVVVPVVALMPVVTAVVGEESAGEEDHRDDEYDPGDDRDPRRESVEPKGLGRLGSDRSRCAGGFRKFTHEAMMRTND
jgi:hypothetical protein